MRTLELGVPTATLSGKRQLDENIDLGILGPPGASNN